MSRRRPPSRPQSARDTSSDDAGPQGAARAEWAGGRACRRRDRADVRAVAHQGRRAGRCRRGDARRRTHRRSPTASHEGALLEVVIPPPTPAPGSCAGDRRGSARSCTTTMPSSWSTSRSASPPTPAWAGPGRPSSVTWPAAGFRIATSGVPERQGIVQRLDVGTSGLMVVAKSEHAYSRLKRAFKQPHRRQDLPRAGAGPPRPAASARSTHRSRDTPSTTTSSRSVPAAGTA